MRPLIGFVLETFPNASDPFILNEILELERQGLDIHIFSLRRPSEQDNHPDVARLKAPITYLPSLLPKFDKDQEQELINAQVALFSQNSAAYLKTLKLYLKRHQEQRFNEFLQGGYLAWQLQNSGILHLHAHNIDVPTATVEIAQSFSGVSYSVTTHPKDSYLTDAAILNQRMAKAEFMVTCSEHSRQYLDQIATADTPIHISYHGVDVASFSPAPRSPMPQVPFILSVGHLCEESGFTYLLRALHLLQQRGSAFHCALVGEGPHKELLQRQIIELDLADSVDLVGELSQQQLIHHYQRADLFVSPYLLHGDCDRDGIPSPLLEAMAMELPVVTTNILGISELLQSHYNGILVPEKDDLAIAQTLERLIDQPDFCTILGKTARLTVLDKFGLISNMATLRGSLLKAVKRPMRHHFQPSIVADLLNLKAS